MDILEFSALEIASKVSRRDISAREVLEANLSHIQNVDGVSGTVEGDKALEPDKVHAFITLTIERARKQADALDKRLASGEAPGVLAGVPATVKDIYCVEDTPSTAASKILANFTAPYTATAVERMESAGAIVLGKVNLDEFTYGSSSESSAFQPAPRNPWNPERVPGGSSGGSAAAVAAREGCISLGTDTAGSIRQPAAFCGVVGMKPTYGRVSRYGLIAFGSSLDCPGPVARNVTDAALLLKVISGQDHHDATAVTVPVPDYLAELEKGIKGLRIGLSPDYFRITYYDHETGDLLEQPLPAEIRSAVEATAKKLEDLGAVIVDNVPMSHTKYGIPAYFVISRVEAASNLHRYDGVKYGYRTHDPVGNLSEMYKKSRGQGFGLQPKLRILMGMYVSAAQYSEQYYNRALRIRSLIRRDFDEIFDQSGKYCLNALLTPTTPTTAFRVGGLYGDSVLMQYADQLTVPGNHAGVPGISIPTGYDHDGLPIGIQFMGPDFSEEVLLKISRAYELVTETEPWRSIKPIILGKPVNKINNS
jgi:aspartyl-tRNA(Asn)/glutamyl-tRNA(Gln) amidotransferase subunit A